jgi:RNA recognition motif-containing protein
LNIYVGNLPRTATEESVRELFSEYGEVTEVKILKDQYSGELRGFGFITMSSKADGQKAINEINGTEVDGRSLIVNEARPKGDSKSGGGGGRSRSGGGGRSHGPRSRSW